MVDNHGVNPSSDETTLQKAVRYAEGLLAGRAQHVGSGYEHIHHYADTVLALLGIFIPRGYRHRVDEKYLFNSRANKELVDKKGTEVDAMIRELKELGLIHSLPASANAETPYDVGQTARLTLQSLQAAELQGESVIATSPEKIYELCLYMPISDSDQHHLKPIERVIFSSVSGLLQHDYPHPEQLGTDEVVPQLGYYEIIHHIADPLERAAMYLQHQSADPSVWHQLGVE